LVDSYKNNLEKWIPTGSQIKAKGRYDVSRNLILIISGTPALILTTVPFFRSFAQNYSWYDWFPIFIFGMLLLFQVAKLRRFG
jgi:hypothetical protein